MGEQHNLYAYSGNNPTTWGDPSGRAVLAEYGALVGDQADMAEVISSGVGNCANASFGRATASLEGYQLGEDPGQAVLRDCAKGAAKAAAMGAVFSGGGRLVGAGLDAARSGRAISKAADVRTGARALPAGPQPTAAIGPVGNPGAFDSVTPPRFQVDGTGTVTDLHAPSGTPTFRGDSRSPSQIFDEGFDAVGDDLDLLRHAEGYPNSGYVSTSQSSAVAGGFPDGIPTNVYEVRAPGGIDVNDVLGPNSPYPWELEIAYPGSIASSCVVGCTLPNGQWVPNPNVAPR